MNRKNLISTLHHIALKNGSREAGYLVMVCMTELMKSRDEDTFRATQARCRLALADLAGPHVIEVTIQYQIQDHALVDIAWRQAHERKLRLEPGWLVDADIAVCDGVIALCYERPLLAITAVEDNCLRMQVGGFEKAMVFHQGNLMGLSRQVINNVRK